MFRVCICSLRYTACNAHEPYGHPWSVRRYNVFTQSHKRHEFRNEKSYWTYNVCFDCLCNLVWNIILLHVKCTLFISDLIQIDFSRQIFEKYIHTHEISWKSVKWEPSCSMRTDGRTDMTKLTVDFHNCAIAPHTCPFQQNYLLSQNIRGRVKWKP